jgi:hypothetical protein
MTTTLLDLAGLDPAAVAENTEILAGLLGDLRPELDLNPGGVLHGAMLRPMALFHTLNQTNLDRLRRSSSLLEVLADPTLVDEAGLDALLANYRISRTTGSAAAGTVLVTTTTLSPLAIPDSVTLTSNGVTFRPAMSFAGVTREQDLVGAGDRLLRPMGTSTYAMLMEVVATSSGVEGNLRRGDQLTTSSLFFQDTTFTAAADFDGGKAPETNAQLLDRLDEGVAARDFGSRLSIGAALRVAFPGVQDVSVIGAMDPELRRDRHNALGIATPGRADLYVRSRSTPLETTITRQATLVSAAEGLWTVSLDREASPGFYEVTRIARSDGVGTQAALVSVTRGMDNSLVAGLDTSPFLGEAAHAAYSRYQTADVLFTDLGVTGLVDGDSRYYDLSLLAMPSIGTISDYVMGRESRHPSGDYLVRAPVPCMVTASINLVRGPRDAEPDIAAATAAVVDAINGLDFVSGRVTANHLAAAVGPHLPGRTRVAGPILLAGRLSPPDGESVWLQAGPSNGGELLPPNLPLRMISRRTVSFYATHESIAIYTLPPDHLPV